MPRRFFPVELGFDGIGLFLRGRARLLAGGSAELHTRQDRVVEAITVTGAELHQHYRVEPLPGG